MNVWVNESIIKSALADQQRSEISPSSVLSGNGSKSYQHFALSQSKSNLSTKSSFESNYASSRKATWVWVQSVVVSGSAHGLFGSSTSSSRSRSNKTTTSSSSYTRPSSQQPQTGDDLLTIRITDPDSEHVNEIIAISRRHFSDMGKGRGILPANNAENDPRELPSDLTTLTTLNEPAVVDCLSKRYTLDGWKMYTSSGPILIAINPCRNINGLYDETAMKMYWQHGERLALPKNDTTDDTSIPPPHVFGVADSAYRGMMRGLDFARSNDDSNRNNIEEEEKKDDLQQPTAADDIVANQSVLVSGESGAGKTVTTKFIMQYLAALSKKVDSDHATVTSSGRSSSEQKSSIESRVLQSNAILESFGNARTLRNDNSSRFGKFIELRFSDRGRLIGASIDTYLLEKARIVGHTCGERTYHIFYEVLAKGSLTSTERKKFFIDNTSPTDFAITTSDEGKDKSRLMHNGYDDHAKMFSELRSAMNTMGFNRPEQMEIFQAICGLLHLSNLTLQGAFVDTNDGEECMLNKNSASLDPALKLLGVSYEALNAAVTTVSFKAVNELVKKNLNASQSIRAVQALIKGAYDAIFSLLVGRINSCITGGDYVDDHHSPGAFIGLLDIFGFESFEKNSFEQLCINYCNESLQQQFNRFVFKLEQQEYQREGIKWDMIEFEDNQDILDLIEKKHGGILTTLDEQCKLGMRCNDKTFVSAVYKKCMSTSTRFDASKKQQSQGKFSIHHYAGLVEYDTSGFMEKNKDEIPMETSDLFSSSSCSFMQDVGMAISSKMNSSQKESKRNVIKSSISRVSVGGQFSAQLQRLRRRIDETHPHYVRCLKPNDQLQPNHFDNHIVVDQLRCGGILEAIRVSRAGFPHRYTFEHFVSRFGVILSALAMTPRSETKKTQFRPRKVGRLNLGNREATATPAKRKVVAPKKPRIDPKKSCESLVKIIARYILAEREKNKEEEEKPVEEEPQSADSLSPRSFWASQSPNKRGGNTNIHQTLDTSEAGIQMGSTKVFLLQDTFDCIERVRGQVMASNATRISSCIRGWLARRAYREILRSMRESIRRSLGRGDIILESHDDGIESRDDVVRSNVDVNIVELYETKSSYEKSQCVEKPVVEFEWVSIGHGRFVKKQIFVVADYVDL